jgi:hypothetical protein
MLGDMNLVDDDADLIISLINNHQTENTQPTANRTNNNSSSSNSSDKTDNSNSTNVNIINDPPSNIYDLFDIDENNNPNNHNNEKLFFADDLKQQFSTTTSFTSSNKHNTPNIIFNANKKRYATASPNNSSPGSPSLSPSPSPLSVISCSAPSSFQPLLTASGNSTRFNFNYMRTSQPPSSMGVYSNENSQDSNYSLTLPTQSYLEKSMKTKKKRINGAASGSASTSKRLVGKKASLMSGKEAGKKIKDLDNLNEEHNEDDFANEDDEDSILSRTSQFNSK